MLKCVLHLAERNCVAFLRWLIFGVHAQKSACRNSAALMTRDTDKFVCVHLAEYTRVPMEMIGRANRLESTLYFNRVMKDN